MNTIQVAIICGKNTKHKELENGNYEGVGAYNEDTQFVRTMYIQPMGIEMNRFELVVVLSEEVLSVELEDLEWICEEDKYLINEMLGYYQGAHNE